MGDPDERRRRENAHSTHGDNEKTDDKCHGFHDTSFALPNGLG
jgi:hypothetical protein